MASTNRDLILGRLEEHRTETKSRLTTIEKKIDTLMGFRWKIIGLAALTSALTSAGLAIILAVIAMH